MKIIIAEKPSQGENIADAFHLTSKEEIFNMTIGKQSKEIKIVYFFGMYEGEEIMVLSAKGHLLELRGRSSSKSPLLEQIAMFNFSWKPPTRRSLDKLCRFQLIKKHFKKADEIIGATDNDEEGELIFYNLVQYLKPTAKISRMIYISMTKKSVIDAYNKRGNIRENIAKSAELRSWMDKSFGYIFSKFLTKCYCKVTKDQYIQLGVGRVITPTLSHIIENMEQIEEAKLKLKDSIPKTIINFSLKAQLPIPTKTYWDDYLQDLSIEEKRENITMEEARILKNKYSEIKGNIIDTKIKHYFIEASKAGLTIDNVEDFGYRKGIDYTRTDGILEALYINKHISYPRSESKILPEEPEYHKYILSNCLKYLKLDDPKIVEDLIIRDVPLMGDENDQAHYGIHPTEVIPGKLPYDYQILYEYIVKDYVIGFCKNKTFKKYECTVEYPIEILPIKKRLSINFKKILDKLNKFEDLYDVIEEVLDNYNREDFEFKCITNIQPEDFNCIEDLECIIDYYDLNKNYMGFVENLHEYYDYWKIIKDYGWEIVENISYLNYEEEDDSLVQKLNIGDEIDTFCKIDKTIETLKLPTRITKKELRKFMKENSLGTDATRSLLMNKLWGFNINMEQIYPILVRGERPTPTILGMRIYDAIKKINIELTRTSLTRTFEGHIKDVIESKEKPETIKEQIKKEITEIIKDRLNDMEDIGTEIAYFGECLKCKSRMKLISWITATKSYFFLACESKECNFTAPI